MKEFFARVKSACLLMSGALAAAYVAVVLRQNTVGVDAVPMESSEAAFANEIPMDEDEAAEEIRGIVDGFAADRPIAEADTRGILDAVLSLGWVKNASVRRAYPGKIAVTIEAKNVIAYMYRDGAYHPVDEDGNVLSAGSAHVPKVLISGEGANREAAGMLGFLRGFPDIYGNLAAMQLVNRTRWNIILFGVEGGLLIKLASEDAAASLLKIEELNRRQAVLKRDIAEIDARNPEKILVKPRR
ncbi:MAG: cell division protein FtsQ/DivIB [Rickettsiales bacterium]|jgi:cell division protein FtsQ|nr:cell division protein FtsQ/DivIB [Rickettsiales bacterium]